MNDFQNKEAIFGEAGSTQTPQIGAKLEQAEQSAPPHDEERKIDQGPAHFSSSESEQRPPPQADIVDKEALINSHPPLQNDPRPNVTLLMVGHAEAGKSTLCGRLLLDLKKVDERIASLYEQEAAENGRSSLWLAYIMDTSDDERERGKTVELGRAYFETPRKRVVLLDAPGHKGYLPNMIQGSAQADVVCIVISALPGEFEAGIEPGGQTIQHALIAKARGVSHFVVVVTKMDEAGQGRFEEIVERFGQFMAEACRVSGRCLSL